MTNELNIVSVEVALLIRSAAIRREETIERDIKDNENAFHKKYPRKDPALTAIAPGVVKSMTSPRASCAGIGKIEPGCTANLIIFGNDIDLHQAITEGKTNYNA